MKTYYIFDVVRNDVNCLVNARNEKSALKKYRSNMLTNGIYEIVRNNDYKYALISSYGSYVVAVPCSNPETMRKNHFLVTIE